GRALCLRQLSGHRRALPAASQGTRPKEARRDPRKDAAPGAREGARRAGLGTGLSERGRAAGRQLDDRLDSRVPLYRAVRGPDDQKRLSPRGSLRIGLRRADLSRGRVIPIWFLAIVKI